MTLAKFYSAAGISTKKQDWEGYGYMTIVETFRKNAVAGYENGDLTAGQRDGMIRRGYTIADSLSY